MYLSAPVPRMPVSRTHCRPAPVSRFLSSSGTWLCIWKCSPKRTSQWKRLSRTGMPDFVSAGAALVGVVAEEEDKKSKPPKGHPALVGPRFACHAWFTYCRRRAGRNRTCVTSYHLVFPAERLWPPRSGVGTVGPDVICRCCQKEGCCGPASPGLVALHVWITPPPCLPPISGSMR